MVRINIRVIVMVIGEVIISIFLIKIMVVSIVMFTLIVILNIHFSKLIPYVAYSETSLKAVH